MITTRQIGKQKEYTETVTQSCGHTTIVTTLYKVPRTKIQHLRAVPCGRCKLEAMTKENGDG